MAQNSLFYCSFSPNILQAEVVEALRRSKFKFSGRQKIFVSKKFGFTQAHQSFYFGSYNLMKVRLQQTKWNRDEYQEMRASGHLKTDGVNVQYMPEHGPLSVWCKTQMELAGL